MPVCIPGGLPAISILQDEAIPFLTNLQQVPKNDLIYHLAILNLMPKKIETENQLLRLLSASPIYIEVTFLQPATHQSKNTSTEHLNQFYHTFDEIQHRDYDGLIITGAPVEQIPFEEVDYWQELTQIMEWSKTHVRSTFHICWGAQAGLYYHYGIQKYPLPDKKFGIFHHIVHQPNHPLVRGFDEVFVAPHSRHTEIRVQDILNHSDLTLLSSSDLAGVYLVADKTNKNFFVTGHSEYDRDTLKGEYERDVAKNLPIELPYHYFPKDDPSQTPLHLWKSHAHLLYTNWLHSFVVKDR